VDGRGSQDQDTETSVGFYAEWNFSCVNLKRAIADILLHGGHKYDILDAHLPSLQQR
jgi:hypothetical protein